MKNEIETKRKSELNENDYMEFLLFLYFGKGRDYISNCTNLAYLDFCRTLHGLYKFEKKKMLKNDAISLIKDELNKLQTSKLIVSQDEFDKWHEETCFSLQNKFAEYGFKQFYIGQAQKWINMSLKYLYVYGSERISGFDRIYEYCHIPIDKIILEKLDYKKFGTTAWSRIEDYSLYLDFQKYIRDKAGDRTPLDFEFTLFME